MAFPKGMKISGQLELDNWSETSTVQICNTLEGRSMKGIAYIGKTYVTCILGSLPTIVWGYRPEAVQFTAVGTCKVAGLS